MNEFDKQLKLLTNKVMQVCIDSPTKFLGESLDELFRKELQKIKNLIPNA